MESDTEMEDFDSSEEGSNWSDDSYLADEDFSFDYQEGVDPHEDALDWEEDSNESAGDTPPRVTPRKESQSESGVKCSDSPEEPWLPCKGSQSTRTSSVKTDEDEAPLLSTLQPDQQRSPSVNLSTKTYSPRKRVPASPSLKSKVPRLSTPRKTSHLPHRTTESDQPWKTEKHPDEGPQPLRFCPSRPPGPQVDPSAMYSPLDLFQMFFTKVTVRTLCDNTNRQAARNIGRGKKFKWIDITVKEFYKFIGLVFFTALVKTKAISDYWITNSIFSIPFPATVMNRDRYRIISWNIHMSDPDEDAVNDSKKGTPEYDRLFRLKPLMNDIRHACMSCFHPHRNLAVDERMVASKARNGLIEYIKSKPTKFGFKIFVLADSSNGYTVDYAVYIGKNTFPVGFGICHDSVMSLVRPSVLGAGYHVYLDNYFSSPKLFKDLFDMKMGACGTMREGRLGFPRSEENALTKKSPRGSLRWIREGSLLFVKWKDAREVSMGTTIHQAYGGETIKRKRKNKDGKWSHESIPVPTPILEYNKNMGGVDLSDQLITYFSAHRKTMKWYRTLFYHFVDIATTNSYIIHKDLCKVNKMQPMTHKEFTQALVAQLCEVSIETQSKPTNTGHTPVPIKPVADKSKRSSAGRKRCELCKKSGHSKDTPWKCNECGVPLCVIPDRNCFHDWHNLEGMAPVEYQSSDS
ncbi:piggyBac transposable element-derived protein 4-like isoform X1 [Salvelinus fontinalis]|uniref:piggyBac transposable element-derived protein 4-like isoform X1 n=1 Tax=Salvelinus fontinalis TaxID=8038 RepID=UPI00248667E1|nr:piggyBac transposable element-derived protein 4-like isoform X1 [Salvelinus fontinalis]